MIDWQRLEQEMADLHRSERIADRIVHAARRQRTRRGVLLTGGVLALAAAVAVPLLASPDGGRAGRDAAGGTGFGDTSVHTAVHTAVSGPVQAAIYAAALSGAARPIWVRNHICDQVPASPATPQCRDAPIPVAVQRQVVDLLGGAVRFAGQPSVPELPRGGTVVGFGPLRVRGDRARLGMETVCGGLCGQGETLVLRMRDGRWQVAGSVGPRWVS